MKYILSVFASFALILINPVYAEEAKHETKQVCKDKTDKAGKPVIDKKTGKPAQECKQVKMHKKLEVTK